MSRILTSIHGRRLGLDLNNKLIAPGGHRIGEHGAQVDQASGACVALFDDFLGAGIAEQWVLVKGSDGGTVNFAIDAGALNGTATGTAGAGAGVSEAVNGVEILSGRHWQAQKGDVVAEARLKISAITNIALFFGFTDKVTLEAPIIGSGAADAFTTNATDGVGFVFDTAMTTKKLWLMGVANNVDAAAQNTGIAPVAATFITLRVELLVDGSARFFINGLPVGQLMAGAVTKTVNLTAALNIFTRSAATATATVDFINASGNRG